MRTPKNFNGKEIAAILNFLRDCHPCEADAICAVTDYHLTGTLNWLQRMAINRYLNHNGFEHDDIVTADEVVEHRLNAALSLAGAVESFVGHDCGEYVLPLLIGMAADYDYAESLIGRHFQTEEYLSFPNLNTKNHGE